MWYPFISITPTDRPSRNIPESEKDLKYHLNMGRHFAGRINSDAVNDFRRKYAVNQAFFRGQWGTEEDVKTFLMDGEYSNRRTALGRNIISPMVNRLKGSAKSMGVSASAQVRTSKAQTRYEEELSRTILMATTAQTSPIMAAALSTQEDISPNVEDSVGRFEARYQDPFARGMTSLLTRLADSNNFEGEKMEYAERLALSGLIASHARLRGSRIEWEAVLPNEVLWDTLCNKSDFSDAEFVAMAPLMDIASVGETFNISKDELKALEQSMNAMSPYGTQNRNSYPEGKPRVFTVYWKDIAWKERGYVDIEGEPTFVPINEVYIKNGNTYTDKDLIDPPDDPINQRGFEGKKKIKKAIEVVRSVSFIPREYLGAKPDGNSYHVADQVLDYGIYPIQEEDPDDSSCVSFPLKLSAWAYIDGYITAPVNDAIDPQRFINRTTANIDWLLGKTGGKNVAIDGRSIDPKWMDEAQVQTALKEGDPVILDGTVAGGLNNAMVPYDKTPGPGLMNLFSMIGAAGEFANSATGISEPAQGTPTGPDQRVGVTQMLLQQTGIILTPFYEAIWRLYEQKHQFNAQVGKQFYSRYPSKLSQLVGDDDAAAIIASKDAKYETFRVAVMRDVDFSQRVEQSRATVMSLLQMQLLDGPTATSLLAGRALEDEVFMAASRFMGEQAAAAQQQQQNAAQQQQLAAIGMKEAQLQEEQKQVYDDALKATSEADKLKSKNIQPVMQKQAETMFPEETPA